MAAAFSTALARVRDGSVDHLATDQINQLARTTASPFRDRLLSPGHTLRLFAQQIAHGNIACAAMRHLAGEDFTDSAWCAARSRLSIDLIRQVNQRIVDDTLNELDRCDDAGSGRYRWRGHRIFILDGTTDSMPDTPALREHYGVPCGVRPGLGFPMAHLLALMDHQSGLILDCIDSPLFTSDVSVSPQMHPHLNEGDVLLGDGSFAGYAHLALISRAKLHAVMPAHHRRIVDFKPDRSHAHPRQGKSGTRAGKPRSRVIKSLGKDDQLVEYFKPAKKSEWMSDEEWKALPDSITVREIRRTVQRHGFRPITVTIVTTLLDAEAYPADELIELRLTRWLIETNFHHLKITLGMGVLKCKTLDGVRKERLIFILVYNLIRRVMLHAARRQGVQANRVSFADALAWLRYASAESLKRASPSLIVNPIRPGRLEPRKLKRQKKEFPYMKEPREKLKAELRDRHMVMG